MNLEMLDSAAGMALWFFLGYVTHWAMDTLDDIRTRLEKEAHDDDA